MANRRNRLVLFTALFMAAAFIGGCMTTGRDRSVDTSKSIVAVEKDISKMLVQVDATGSALDALVMVGQPNLDKSFKTFSKSLEKLEDDGKDLIKRVDELKANNVEYFSEWEKQGESFTNPAIRETSETRRSEMAKIYAQVPEASFRIKGSYNAYLSNLKQIQQYLSNDLTPKGIEGIKPVAEKSVQEREELKASMQPVLTALEQIRVELYSGKK